MIVCDKNHKPDLTLPVMIVLSGMALTLGFPTENAHANRHSFSVEVPDSQVPKECPTCPLCRSSNTRHKNKICTFLEPIILKLEIVIEKYEEKKHELEKFYREYDQLPLPNYDKPTRFGCLNFKQLKFQRLNYSTKTKNFICQLPKLRTEVRETKKSLKCLIYFEKSSKFKKYADNEGRIKLLREFLAEVKNLLVELNHDRNKRRNKSLTRRVHRKARPANLSHINSQTKLKMEERVLLESFKRVLQNWRKNLKNFSGCMCNKS